MEYLPKSRMVRVDAVVFFGDMVYWANGESENSFMRSLEMVEMDLYVWCSSALDYDENSNTNARTQVPVHVSPGNGDSGDNFSSYYVRFSHARDDSTIPFGTVSISDLPISLPSQRKCFGTKAKLYRRICSLGCALT